MRSAAFASFTLIAVLALSPIRTQAESLVLSTADARLVLAFQVPASIVQTVVPAEWQPTPIASGPSTGANVMLIFVDGIAQSTPTESRRPAVRTAPSSL